jgi:uncharacterized GH25 family protein
LFPFTNSPKLVLKGKVTDDLGAVISQARVLVNWDPSGSQVGLKSNAGTREDMSVTTDEQGEFEMELAPGFYALFVSSEAFSPVCQKIRQKEEVHPLLNFKLKADPLVSKELGHEIRAN